MTKLAGPFSDTCRCSISPRSRLRLQAGAARGFDHDVDKGGIQHDVKAYGVARKAAWMRRQGVRTGCPDGCAAVKAVICAVPIHLRARLLGLGAVLRR